MTRPARPILTIPTDARAHGNFRRYARRMLIEREPAADNATARALFAIAHVIIDNAEHERRDLSDFEAGQVDTLLGVAGVLRTTPAPKGD